MAPDAWRPADGLTLEPNALRAAQEQERCLALTAGPGAGKTEMLAQRADFLLRTARCRYPKRILAISFKVDASKNLKERVRRRCGPDLASRFDSYTFHAFAKRIVDRFRPLLSGCDALDAGYALGDQTIAGKQIKFEALIPLAVKILRQSVVARNAIRQTYTDVFLDEFQDCTEQQYELIKVVFQGTPIRLTAVGDTKQKIMGWAGALDGIFQTFAADFNAVPLNMYRNFRSQPVLLRMQNEIISVLDPASRMSADQLVGEGGEVTIASFDNGEGEATYLADLIARWTTAEQVPLSDIAVLVSKQLDQYAHLLMTALEKRGIPYRNEQQLQDISTEPCACLIVDYLSCLYGKREPKAWIRLMNQLIPFGDDEMVSMARQSLLRFINAQRKEVALKDLIDAPFSGWWDFALAFVKKVGIETIVALSQDYEARTRLKAVIAETKSRILELMALEPDLPTALGRFSDDKALRILTIHKCKGLEFDSVIMMAVENEIFFGDRDANRCAFFVGVSRAKRRLVLTHAGRRERPPGFERRWDIQRTRQDEYFGYAEPFVR